MNLRLIGEWLCGQRIYLFAIANGFAVGSVIGAKRHYMTHYM